MQAERNLILIRGVSGAGKSTIGELLFESDETEVLSTDDMFMVDGEYKFDPSKLGEYHAAIVQKVKDVMIDRQFEIGSGEDLLTPTTIVVHNTFTQEWEMKPYFELAETFGWRVHTIIVENRHGSKSIHDVPDAALKAQKERFEVIL